jgi:hypothetical protein
MAEASKDTAGKFRFEFYKNVMTFALATLGGEVTLLQSLYKDAEVRGVAYASILAITISCLFILGAQEALVKRVDPLQISGRLGKILNTMEIRSAASERILEGLSGSLYAVGLILFIAFVLKN